MNAIHLSGPITDRKDFNYPTFNAEAARPCALGYTVENPVENAAIPEHMCELHMRAAIR